MALRLGDVVPDFTADSTAGSLSWHEYIGGSWSVLFSHPGDFTPVCTTELGSVADLQGEFDRRGVKVAALSCNDTASHRMWIGDIEALDYCRGHKVTYPIIADPGRDVAVLYGMLDPVEVRLVSRIDPSHPTNPNPTQPNFQTVCAHWDRSHLADTPSVSRVAASAEGQGRPTHDLPRGLRDETRQDARALPSLPRHHRAQL